MDGKIRRLIINKIPSDKKTKFIQFYIRFFALYTQGTATVSSFRVISLEKIVAGMACLKIIYPQIDPLWIACAGCIYYPMRTIFNYAVGLLWEDADGYKIQAAWNKHRDAPQRVYIMEQEKDLFTKPGEADGNSRRDNQGSSGGAK